MLRHNARRDRLAVGLMSGTSMDGVDAALVRLGGPAEKPRVSLRAFVSIPYPERLQQRLLSIAGGDGTTAEEISQLNFLLGELFAEAALQVCCRAGVSKGLAVIGSHGQTIHHCGPGPKRLDAQKRTPLRASTLQIAEPAVIAEKTGVPVVTDFRTADIAAGGQGAPLVPMADYLLLRHPKQGTVALNIGGIANLTVIPASASSEQVFGFDTGPGNMVMDGLVRHFTRGRKSYDARGRIAADGKVIEALLAESLRFSFFSRKPPRSAGREQFGEEFVKEFFPKRGDAHFEDLLRTAAELTVRTIADALEQLVFPRVTIQRLIVSGGGAHNQLLMKRLAELLPQLSVQTSDRYGLPVDAKEAIAFALLADRTLHGLPGNIPAVTGARRAVVLGKIARPWKQGLRRLQTPRQPARQSES